LRDDIVLLIEAAFTTLGDVPADTIYWLDTNNEKILTSISNAESPEKTTYCVTIIFYVRRNWDGAPSTGNGATNRGTDRTR
jgi:hypothetical protein